MNKLTEQLLQAGYTKDDHPDYVKWSNWQDFEYTREYLLKTVWETPCGLLKKGINSYTHESYMGVNYCPENDNPKFGCPYYDEKPCQYRDNTIKFWGSNCIYHKTDRLYDYEQSVEKLWDEWDKIQNEAYLDATSEHGFCINMVWDRPKRKYIPRFIVEECIHIGCQNVVCAITKRTRNLEKVNIFYDVLRKRHYKKGLIENTERSITKGVKKFEKPIARTDAEIWLKENKEEFEPRLTQLDRKELFFSEHHGDTGYGEYDFCKFTVTPINIRIEKRESRDMLQDLTDAREGIEVRHESDLKKAAKIAKSERLKKAKEKRNRPKNVLKKIISHIGEETVQKVRKLEKLGKTSLDIVQEIGISRNYVDKILSIPEEEKKQEQMSLF